MKTSPNNQHIQTPSSLGKPEKTNRTEERRQKACALRTFEGADNLSPAVLRAGGEDRTRMPGHLSIQIDTCKNIPRTAKTMTVTATRGGILSPDKFLKVIDNSKYLSDKTGAPCDRIRGRNDRKQPLPSRIVGKEKDHA